VPSPRVDVTFRLQAKVTSRSPEQIGSREDGRADLWTTPVEAVHHFDVLADDRVHGPDWEGAPGKDAGVVAMDRPGVCGIRPEVPPLDAAPSRLVQQIAVSGKPCVCSSAESIRIDERPIEGSKLVVGYAQAHDVSPRDQHGSLLAGHGRVGRSRAGRHVEWHELGRRAGPRSRQRSRCAQSVEAIDAKPYASDEGRLADDGRGVDLTGLRLA